MQKDRNNHTVFPAIKIILFNHGVFIAHRSFTDLSRSHSLFSLATPSSANDFLIWKETEEGQLSIYVRNQRVTFIGQNYKVNTWHSICATWDSASGVAQLWLDGMFSSRKFVSSGSNITGPITIILGQVECLCTLWLLKRMVRPYGRR